MDNNNINEINVSQIEIEEKEIEEISEHSLSENIDEEITNVIIKIDKESQTNNLIDESKSQDKYKQFNKRIVQFILFSVSIMIIISEHYNITLLITINGFVLLTLSLFFTKIIN